MKLTNNHNLPLFLYERIRKSVQNSPYNVPEPQYPVFRTTALIDPPLIRTLRERYQDSDEWVVDAAEYLHMIFGTAVHKILEGPDTETVRHEVQIQTKLTLPDGQSVWVCGTIDEEETLPGEVRLSDNKTCKAVNTGFKDKESYEHQLQIYSYIGDYTASDKPVRLFLRYYVKDFSPKDVGTELWGNPYPACAYVVSEVPAKSHAEVQEYILGRLNDHLQNPDRICTLSERCFGNENKIEWAVKVEGRIFKSGKKAGQPNTGAVKVFSVKDGYTEQDALAFLGTLKPEEQLAASIEVRNADIRCQYYCDVKSVCPYARSKGYC